MTSRSGTALTMRISIQSRNENIFDAVVRKGEHFRTVAERYRVDPRRVNQIVAKYVEQVAANNRREGKPYIEIERQADMIGKCIPYVIVYPDGTRSGPLPLIVAQAKLDAHTTH